MLPDTSCRNQELQNFSALTRLDLPLSDTKNQTRDGRELGQMHAEHRNEDTRTGNPSLPLGGHRHTEHSHKHSTNSIILLPPLAEHDSEDVDPAAVPASQPPQLLALDVGVAEVTAPLRQLVQDLSDRDNTETTTLWSHTDTAPAFALETPRTCHLSRSWDSSGSPRESSSLKPGENKS